MKKNQVARGVRVILNENFKNVSLGDQYLMMEPVIFIDDSHVYNDSGGEYVFIKGGSLMNGTSVYLDEIDLEFPIPELPMYPLHHEENSVVNYLLRERDKLEQRIFDLDPDALINYELAKLNLI